MDQIKRTSPIFILLISIIVVSAALVLFIGFDQLCIIIDELSQRGWLTPLVIFISSMITLLGIGLTLHSNRKVVKDRETMTYIFDRLNNSELRKSINVVYKIHETGTPAIHTLADEDKLDTEEAIHVRKVLNHFETLCVCINKNIYSTDMLIDTMITSLVETFDHCKPYIKAVRQAEKNHYVFDQYEKTYRKWSKILVKRKNRANKKNGAIR